MAVHGWPEKAFALTQMLSHEKGRQLPAFLFTGGSA